MRLRTLLIPVVSLGLLAACGDSAATPGSSAASSPANTGTADTIAAPPAIPKPQVEIPATLPTELKITDLTEGTGAAAAAGDTLVVHYIGVRSADGTEFDNNFDGGSPFEVTPLGTAQVIKGWNQGLIGVKQGGRRQLDLPADLAYGDAGSGDIIKPGDALTFVIDVVGVVPKTNPANAPKETVSASPNQAELTFTDLIVGDGAAVQPGQTAAVQIVAFSAADGKQLTSSWESPFPFRFVFGAKQALPGIDKGTDGMKVGGRREVHVPFADGFGVDGNTDLGLAGSIDLILILDLVAAY
jgi:peptidylprolyl isomerase